MNNVGGFGYYLNVFDGYWIKWWEFKFVNGWLIELVRNFECVFLVGVGGRFWCFWIEWIIW